MQRDPRAYLEDVLRCIAAVKRFTAGKSFADYEADLLLRSAVERQLSIIGEALSQLKRVAPDVAARIEALGEIVAFRNRLVHGYAQVSDAVVWGVVEEDLAPLAVEAQALLAELDG
jgi:uncharacterized protein with HEPN domain